jgi:hypothetical protein
MAHDDGRVGMAHGEAGAHHWVTAEQGPCG